MIRENEIDIPLILSLLNKLGANPNPFDSDGNTCLHYASFLPFFGVTKELVVEICKKLKKFGALSDSKITNVNRLYYFACHQLHGE
jgi:ankyrin repeat protein